MILLLTALPTLGGVLAFGTMPPPHRTEMLFRLPTSVDDTEIKYPPLTTRTRPRQHPVLLSANAENETNDNEQEQHQEMKQEKEQDEHQHQQDRFLRPLFQLASAHCTSQALRAFVELNIPNIFLLNNNNNNRLESDSTHSTPSTIALSLEEIANAINGPKTNVDALLRTLRLLTTVHILKEEEQISENDNAKDETNIYFALTEMGQLLGQEESGMAACIQHWMEQPLWDAWLELPSYIKGDEHIPKSNTADNGSYSSTPVVASSSKPRIITTTATSPSLRRVPPFDRANGGISSDYYYNEADHPISLKKANEFVKFIHYQEIQAIINLDFWKNAGEQNDVNDKKFKVLEIGGHYGQVMDALGKKYQNRFDLYSLDLPQVIDACTNPPTQVSLVSGNVFDLDTIPDNCDVLFLKHFLDRCMWTEQETIQILRNCRKKVSEQGQILIAEAVLPSIGAATTQSIELSMDALYMLVGREGQRTESEWERLTIQSGSQIRAIIQTNVASCSILVLEKNGAQNH